MLTKRLAEQALFPFTELEQITLRVSPKAHAALLVEGVPLARARAP